MQTNNPFELIFSKLDQLQSSINLLSIRTEKSEAKRKEEGDPDKLLDLTEAATLMRKPVGTLRYYIHNKSLPATKVGKSYLVKKQALLDWFNQLEHSTVQKDAPIDRMLQNRQRHRKN